MPGQISGGPSRRHTLANQADIDQAEAALQQRVPQGYRKPLPPPAPLPQDMLPDLAPSLTAQEKWQADQAIGMTNFAAVLGGPQLLPAAPPTDEAPAPIRINGLIQFTVESVFVTLRLDDQAHRQFVGEGASLTEAVSIAAGELEVGLAQPVCPHCGQLMPDAEE